MLFKVLLGLEDLSTEGLGVPPDAEFLVWVAVRTFHATPAI